MELPLHHETPHRRFPRHLPALPRRTRGGSDAGVRSDGTGAHGASVIAWSRKVSSINHKG